MAKSADWYFLKLFPAQDLSTSMSYEAHRKSMARMKEKTGIKATSVTHLGRSNGAKAAELAGASEDSIRRSGRWEQSAIARCYLSRLPRETMRVHAGFPKDMGSFWIARDIEVPEPLLNLVFPEAREWQSKHLCDDPGVEMNIAAGGFLNLLMQLRSIVIQDAVLLKQDFPDHFLFQHPIFSTQAFKDYEQTMQEVLQTQETPHDLLLKRAFPVIAEGMKNGFDCVNQRIDRVDAACKKAGKEHSGIMQALAFILEHMSKEPDRVVYMPQVLQAGSTTAIPVMATAVTPLTAANISPTLSSATDNIVPTTTASSVRATLDTVMAASATTSASVLPRFKLLANPTSVEELWREYDEGIAGRPPAKSVYELATHRWTGQDSERKAWSRRLVVVNAIQRWASEKMLSCSLVAARLDELRRLQKPQMTIAKLRDGISSGTFVFTV